MQKNYQTMKTFFLARFAYSAFYKIHIAGSANRHAPVQYAKCYFFFFFFSKQSSWYEPFTSFASFS